VHAAHSDEWMKKAGVQGVGIGSSADAPGEAALVIFLIRGVAHEPIPPVIDGLRTRVRESSRFRVGFGDAPAKPGCSMPAIRKTPEDGAKKNPVPVTADGLAEVRKLYSYNCAMCHGKIGDGKGDLAADMKLELRDWRDANTLEKMTDGELFWIISNGKGKMPGEGDRTKERVRWNFVNLVRSFAKKDAADK